MQTLRRMRTKKLRLLNIGIACLIALSANAQSTNDKFRYKEEIFSTLKQITSYGYNYSLTMIYPDKTSQTLHGRMFVNAKEKVMYNSTEAFELIYTNNWYYRAEHDAKKVVVMDMNKRLNDTAKAELEADLFTNKLYATLIDSVILKNTIISFYKKHSDTVSLSLLVTRNSTSPIRRIDVEYSVSKRLPISMTYYNYYLMGAGYGNNISQVIRCTNFSNDEASIDLSRYFLVTGDKINLKKYPNYTIYKVL